MLERHDAIGYKSQYVCGEIIFKLYFVVVSANVFIRTVRFVASPVRSFMIYF